MAALFIWVMVGVALVIFGNWPTLVELAHFVQPSLWRFWENFLQPHFWRHPQRNRLLFNGLSFIVFLAALFFYPWIETLSSSSSLTQRPFYDRTQELQYLYENVFGKYAVHVITGPPNCGKTRLITEFLNRHKHGMFQQSRMTANSVFVCRVRRHLYQSSRTHSRHQGFRCSSP